MDSQNQTPATDQATAPAPADSNGEEGVKLYSTRKEAEAAKPTGTKKKLYKVGKDGTMRRLWGNGYDSALAAVARADGYTVSLDSAEMSEDAVRDALAGFSDEQLAAMGLVRQHTPTTPPRPTTRGRK